VGALMVNFYDVLLFEQKKDVSEFIIAKNETSDSLRKGIFYYIDESGDYYLRFDTKRTATVPDIIKILKSGITINNTQYGPYIKNMPSKSVSYEEVLESVGFKIIVSNKGKKVDVKFSHKENSSIEILE
jgi:hypothetical protein